MPDITMCHGGDCPMKESCYRHEAKPDPYRQSYFAKPPNNGDECKYFWDVDERF